MSIATGLGRRDQAARLREMAARHFSGLTVAVTSGKGGVGKSNVAVNMSVYLASRGLRVVLVDLDLGLANADLLLDVQARYTLSHVISGVRELAEICVELPCGLRFIPGASGYDSLANLSEFERRKLISQLHNLQNNTDIVVFDCGAGISRNVLSFARAANEVLVVTTPQPTALTDAYATIKALCRAGDAPAMGLLVNMARHKREAVAAYDRIAGVARRFLDYSIANRGYMLQDTAVELAVQKRRPFVLADPKSSASACIAVMAGDMARALRGEPRDRGLLRRVMGLFV